MRQRRGTERGVSLERPEMPPALRRSLPGGWSCGAAGTRQEGGAESWPRPSTAGGGAAKGLAEMWEGWACRTCREEEEGQSIGEESIKEAPNPGQGLQAPLWRGLLKKSLPV